MRSGSGTLFDRLLQRADYACALLLFLIALQPGHPIVAPNSLMSCLVILSLDSCSLERQLRDWNGVHSSFWSVHRPPSSCHSPRYSDHAVDCFRVPCVLRFQYPDFTSSKNTICIPDETLCAVSHSKPNSVLIPGVHRICGDLSCQHFISERDKLSSHRAVSQMASFRHDLSDTWTECIRRAPPTMA